MSWRSWNQLFRRGSSQRLLHRAPGGRRRGGDQGVCILHRSTAQHGSEGYQAVGEEGVTVSGNELGAFFIAVAGAEAAALPRVSVCVGIELKEIPAAGIGPASPCHSGCPPRRWRSSRVSLASKRAPARLPRVATTPPPHPGSRHASASSSTRSLHAAVNRRRFAFAGTSRSEPAFSLDLPVFRTSSIKSHYILARRGRSYNQKVWK